MTKTEKSKRTNRSEPPYEIHCPVTVSLGNRLNGPEQIKGELWEISEERARLLLDKPLQQGTEILLFVHFRHPHKGVVTIRFRGVVERLREQPRFEVAVEFKGGIKFVPSELPKTLSDSAERGKSPTSR